LENQLLSRLVTGQTQEGSSLFSFKLIQKPIIPVQDSYVDSMVYLTLFVLSISALGAVLFLRDRKTLARRVIQFLSATAFLLFFHQCMCIMRDWAYGFQQIGRDSVAAFGNLFLPFALIGYTCLVGRVFCGYICPMGLLVEIAGRFDRFKRRRISDPRRLAILDTVLIVGLMVLMAVLTSYIWPDNRFFYESTATIWTFLLLGLMIFYVWDRPSWEKSRKARSFSLMLWLPLIFFGVFVNNPWCSVYASNLEYSSMASLIVVLLASMVVEMSWCRLVCPLGAFLAIFAARPVIARRVSDEEAARENLCYVSALGEEFEGKFDQSSCFYCTACLGRSKGFDFAQPSEDSTDSSETHGRPFSDGDGIS
jgi:polyferredoxin